MFNPSQQDVRNFWFTTYNKAQNNVTLTDLERMAYSIILEHPEYKYIFENQAKYLDYQWLPEDGAINPILHFALHMAITEQLSIASSIEINALYQQMLLKYRVKHDVEHELMECIGEMIWHAGRNQSTPDMNIYLNCIRKKLED
jgi:hypothetical protein